MNGKPHLDSLNRIHRELRARFPELERDGFGNPRIHLNCGAGTLTVDTAIRAMAEASHRLNSLPGEVAPAELATRDFHAAVRSTVAAFLNASAGQEVSFHVSSTGALFSLAFALDGVLDPRANLVVTDLDHMANVSPWERVCGEARGREVRRWRIDDEGRLRTGDLDRLCDERTGLVAVTMASNALGTIVPLREIIGEVRRGSPRALVCVDAVHHALHGPIDVRDIDCDFLVFSGYKVFGPMLGVLWGRGGLLAKIRPYRVETNKDIPPYKFEMGTLSNASLAALGAALEYLIGIGRRLPTDGSGAGLDARSAVRAAMAAIEAYDHGLAAEVLRGFARLDPARFRCYGVTDPDRSGERDPTFAFEVRGLTPEALKRELWETHRLQVADGNHYSAAVVRHLGRPGICRASLCHYHTPEEARRLVAAVEEIVAKA